MITRSRVLIVGLLEQFHCLNAALHLTSIVVHSRSPARVSGSHTGDLTYGTACSAEFSVLMGALVQSGTRHSKCCGNRETRCAGSGQERNGVIMREQNQIDHTFTPHDN